MNAAAAEAARLDVAVRENLEAMRDHLTVELETLEHEVANGSVFTPADAEGWVQRFRELVANAYTDTAPLL